MTDVDEFYCKIHFRLSGLSCGLNRVKMTDLIHELAHVISDLGGCKSRSAASKANFSAPEVVFYYPFETRLVVLGMACKFCVFAVIVLQLRTTLPVVLVSVRNPLLNLVTQAIDI